MKIINFLKGKKTYLIVVVGVIFNGLYAMGFIPVEYVPAVNIILGFLGLGTLRAGINKIGK